MQHTYNITGMHCQSCAAKITAALERLPGVTSAQVSLHPPQARVDMTSDVPTADLDRAAQSAGAYHIVEANGAAAPLDLVSIGPPAVAPHLEAAAPRESLYPLFLIVGYLVAAVALVAVATGNYSLHVLMRHFMAGFFLVFSFFKLLDLRGFADAYRSYDILARAVPSWAYAYPFVEAALGAAYLLDVAPTATNLATLAFMLLGAVGVLQALLAKRTIRCACLGTALNLPMTKVTLVEDLTMAAMAAAALAFPA